MSVLYVTEQGAVLHRRGRTLVVTKDGSELAEVECHQIEGVLVFGAVQLTTQAMALLLNQGIETAFLTQDGRLKGQLTPIKAKNVVLRLAQFGRAQEADFCLKISRAIVAGKLANSLAGVRRFHNNHPEAPLGEPLDRLESAMRKAGTASDLETLRGIEGAAARSYFQAFACMCLGPLKFAGRSRRPPTDPVNALLSLGYTLLGNELHSLLDARGFDPYIGFYHGVQYGRPSLALDLLEEFRYPVVDRLTLYLNNKGTLKPADFAHGPAEPLEDDLAAPAGDSDEGPASEPAESTEVARVWLTRKGLKEYLAAYEDWLRRPVLDEPTGDHVSCREVFRRQAERLAQAIREPIPYVPHRFSP